MVGICEKYPQISECTNALNHILKNANFSVEQENSKIKTTLEKFEEDQKNFNILTLTDILSYFSIVDQATNLRI